MAVSDNNLLTDAGGKPIPQYYNETADDFEETKGEGGAPRTRIEDGDDVAAGAKGDSAAGDDLSEDWSLVALLKAVVETSRAIEDLLGEGELATSLLATTHGAVETRPTSDSFTNLAGSAVTASTGETVYVLDEGQPVKYDPGDGDADANGWVPLGGFYAKGQAGGVVGIGSAGAAQLPTFTDATRPAAGTAGRVIFNTDDGQLNIDDGTNWTLPDGTTT